jgi:hypothetical protein
MLTADRFIISSKSFSSFLDMSNIKKGKERRKFNNNFYMFFLFIFNWLDLDNTNSEKIFTALDRLFPSPLTCMGGL